MGSARGGLDEGIDVEGFRPWLDRDDRSLSARRPDPAQDRLQSDPVLVGRPDRDARVWLGSAYGRYLSTEVCLKAVWAAGSALTWEGRGTWSVWSRRRR